MTIETALDRAREVSEGVIRAQSEAVDVEGRWPSEGLAALQGAGLGGLVVDTEAGGLGQGLLAVVRVCEVIGRECPSTALAFGMHLVGAAVLNAKATPSQRARYLEPIARGKHLTTLALSEPGTGAHFYIPQATLEIAPGGFRLRGTKSFVTGGGQVDSYVLSAAPGGEGARPGEFSCVVVARDAPGLVWSGPWQGWGMRGNSACSAQLEGVPVPTGDLLGEEGDEIWYVFNVITPYFLMAMTGSYLGAAAAAFEHARRHLLDRRYGHTGASLADSAVIQHRVGSMWACHQRTRSLAFDAARFGDMGHPDSLPAMCSAKAEVAEAAERIASDAMTMVGGRGYSTSHPLHRLYRDIRAAHVMAPTTDILRVWTGRAVLGLPMLGD